MKKIKNKKNSGQAIVEYIIIIVIVAVAALTVMGIFSDTVRQKIAGVVAVFGGDATDAVSTNSADILKQLDANGNVN